MPIIVWPHTFHDGVGEQASGAQVMDNFNALQPEAWKRTSTLGYLNGWADEAGVPGEYRRNPFGVVELRGAIKGGGNTTLAFTLPEGMRPRAGVGPSLIVAAGGGLGYLAIYPNGQVIPSSLAGGNVTAYCHLESSFSVE